MGDTRKAIMAAAVLGSWVCCGARLIPAARRAWQRRARYQEARRACAGPGAEAACSGFRARCARPPRPTREKNVRVVSKTWYEKNAQVCVVFVPGFTVAKRGSPNPPLARAAKGQAGRYELLDRMALAIRAALEQAPGPHFDRF